MSRAQGPAGQAPAQPVPSAPTSGAPGGPIPAAALPPAAMLMAVPAPTPQEAGAAAAAAATAAFRQHMSAAASLPDASRGSGENTFVAGHAWDDRSKCQSVDCRRPLRAGDARIGKRPPSARLGQGKTRWYHLECVFASFRRACRRSKTITRQEDVRNLELLAPEDREKVKQMIDA